jgi:hypothetical protein
MGDRRTPLINYLKPEEDDGHISASDAYLAQSQNRAAQRRLEGSSMQAAIDKEHGAFLAARKQQQADVRSALDSIWADMEAACSNEGQITLLRTIKRDWMYEYTTLGGMYTTHSAYMNLWTGQINKAAKLANPNASRRVMNPNVTQTAMPMGADLDLPDEVEDPDEVDDDGGELDANAFKNTPVSLQLNFGFSIGIQIFGTGSDDDLAKAIAFARDLIDIMRTAVDFLGGGVDEAPNSHTRSTSMRRIDVTSYGNYKRTSIIRPMTMAEMGGGFGREGAKGLSGRVRGRGHGPHTRAAKVGRALRWAEMSRAQRVWRVAKFIR